MSKAIKKYGIENFSKEIIEDCETKQLLNLREKHWINYYNAVDSDDFYNIANGGDGGNTLSGYTDEQLENHSKILSKALKGIINQGANNPKAKQVICLNNMKIFNTTVEASKYAGVCDVTIQSCCNGKTYTAGKDPITKEKLQWEYYYPNNKYELKIIKKKSNHPNIRKVFCYTTKEVFNSAKEASEKYNISINGIGMCCKFEYSYFGKLDDGTKLQWFYYDYYISENFDINKHKINEGVNNWEHILMFDLNDNFEKEFFSRKEANDFVGGRKGGCSKILECLKGKRKTIYGHIWKYAS